MRRAWRASAKAGSENLGCFGRPAKAQHPSACARVRPQRKVGARRRQGSDFVTLSAGCLCSCWDVRAPRPWPSCTPGPSRAHLPAGSLQCPPSWPPLFPRFSAESEFLGDSDDGEEAAAGDFLADELLLPSPAEPPPQHRQQSARASPAASSGAAPSQGQGPPPAHRAAANAATIGPEVELVIKVDMDGNSWPEDDPGECASRCHRLLGAGFLAGAACLLPCLRLRH